MPGSILELNETRVYAVAKEGSAIRTGADAVNLIDAARHSRARFIALPVERLAEEFFELRTRLAGEIAQKFQTYCMRVAIVGDISQKTAASKSLSAFVIESNRGRDLWFVNDLEELATRLTK